MTGDVLSVEQECLRQRHLHNAEEPLNKRIFFHNLSLGMRFPKCCMFDQLTRSLIRAFDSRLNIMSVKLLTEHHLEFLSIQGVCTGSSESKLVKMPHCWKLHVMAHLSFASENKTLRFCFNFERLKMFDFIAILL